MSKAAVAPCPLPPKWPYICDGYWVHADGTRLKALPRNGLARIKALRKRYGEDWRHYAPGS